MESSTQLTNSILELANATKELANHPFSLLNDIKGNETLYFNLNILVEEYSNLFKEYEAKENVFRSIISSRLLFAKQRLLRQQQQQQQQQQQEEEQKENEIADNTDESFSDNVGIHDENDSFPNSPKLLTDESNDNYSNQIEQLVSPPNDPEINDVSDADVNNDNIVHDNVKPVEVEMEVKNHNKIKKIEKQQIINQSVTNNATKKVDKNKAVDVYRYKYNDKVWKTKTIQKLTKIAENNKKDKKIKIKKDNKFHPFYALSAIKVTGEDITSFFGNYDKNNGEEKRKNILNFLVVKNKINKDCIQDIIIYDYKNDIIIKIRKPLKFLKRDVKKNESYGR